MSDSKSKELFDRARRVVPGGVNSPVARSEPSAAPVFVDRASGAYLWGADGTQYTDYVGSWGPMILGHAHPDVIAAIVNAAARGTSYGAPTELEVEYAEALARDLSVDGDGARRVERHRGDDGRHPRRARLHRARRRREVRGCYHGHADFLLVKAGSGAMTLGIPDSAGVPGEPARTRRRCRTTTSRALRALFASRGADIAAVIVEPVVGNMGGVPPDAGVPRGHRRAVQDARRGLDLRRGDDRVPRRARRDAGARRGHSRHDVPRKIVGGGMPLAAYGGSARSWSSVAPLGPVYQAGTLSGNPVAVSAALATIERLDVASTRGWSRWRAARSGARGARSRSRGARAASSASARCHALLRRAPSATTSDAKAHRHRALRPMARRDARARAVLAPVAVRGRVHQRRAHRERHRRDDCRVRRRPRAGALVRDRDSRTLHPRPSPPSRFPLVRVAQNGVSLYRASRSLIQPPRSVRRFLLRPDRGLRRGEPRDRDAERRAAHVVEPDALEELDARRVAPVLAADAELDSGAPSRPARSPSPRAPRRRRGRARRTGPSGGSRLDVRRKELARVVARQPERRLGEVVGAEREELRLVAPARPP